MNLSWGFGQSVAGMMDESLLAEVWGLSWEYSRVDGVAGWSHLEESSLTSGSWFCLLSGISAGTAHWPPHVA